MRSGKDSLGHNWQGDRCIRCDVAICTEASMWRCRGARRAGKAGAARRAAAARGRRLVGRVWIQTEPVPPDIWMTAGTSKEPKDKR